MIILSFFRSLLAFLIFPFWTVLLAITILIIGDSRRLTDKVIVCWGRSVCWLYGVSVSLEGAGNVPTGSCLFLFNHTSFFDVFAMASVLPSFRFGAKIELFKIPIFGRALRRAGALPISRSEREKVFEVYRDAQERVQRGERFALSPEGTRQEIEELADFKSGPFVFAMNSGMPLSPVVIQGAGRVMPKGAFIANKSQWRRHIQVSVLPMIPVSEADLGRRKELQVVIKEQMQTELVRLQKKALSFQ